MLLYLAYFVGTLRLVVVEAFTPGLFMYCYVIYLLCYFLSPFYDFWVGCHVWGAVCSWDQDLSSEFTHGEVICNS